MTETPTPIDWFAPTWGGGIHVDSHGSFVGAEVA